MTKEVEKKSAYETNRDAIVKHYSNPSETKALTPLQKSLVERWEFAHGLLRQYPSRITVRNFLIKKFGYSRAQADRDINDTESFFGEIITRNIIFRLEMRITSLLELAKLAKVRFDFKTAGMLESKAADIELKLYELENKGPKELPKPVNIMQVNFNVGSDQPETKIIDLDKLNIDDTTSKELLKMVDINQISDDELDKMLNESAGLTNGE